MLTLYEKLKGKPLLEVSIKNLKIFWKYLTVYRSTWKSSGVNFLFEVAWNTVFDSEIRLLTGGQECNAKYESKKKKL